MALRACLVPLTLGLAALVAACGGSATGGGPGTGGTGTGASGGAGGGGGIGGVGGSGGGVQVTVDKVDLLFMIDNSLSMADKQEVLKAAVPALVDRLVTPKQIGGKPEFKPVLDIHIGVITSSIGGHGGDQCSEGGPGSNPSQWDNGRLVPSVRPGLPSYDNLGFLWWDAATPPKGNPPGESNATSLKLQFQDHVMAAGEIGCGYEASLEAWYRFLIDPVPPAKMVVNSGNNAEPQGVDDVVLQQRLDFLRPDSLVAIIMLSDENDCSTVDGGFNWIAAQTSNPNGQPFHLPRATAACQTDPDSACCRSCSTNESSPPPGCQSLGSDPQCQQGTWDDVGDHPNLRCWQQKRRFGLEFLYPTARYVEALKKPTICQHWDGNGSIACTSDPSDPKRVPNPLYNNPSGGVARVPDLVYFAGIVGVPWQDIATDDTLNVPDQLAYKTASQLNWDLLTPQCKVRSTPGDVLSPCIKWDLTDDPDDPLMIESTAPRTGANPITGAALADPGGGEAANPINGHEWYTQGGDLQYACIYRLADEKDCGAAMGGGCDCDFVGPGYTANNPLCQGPSGYSKLQRYAKAFPGQRQLEVLRDFGANSIVSSICPKNTVGDPSADGFGYNPTVGAIVDRLKEVLQ